MIKSKILKAMALGLCLSALFTVAVQANSNDIAKEANINETSQNDNILYEKQKEIDQYVFVDHAEDIERKGFSVVYTGIGSNYVEVGISPYKKEYADYLYDIFGSSNIRIVESEKAKTLEEKEPVVDLPVNNDEAQEISPEPMGGGTDGNVGGVSPGFAGYDQGNTATSDIIDNSADKPVASSDNGNSAISPDTSVSYSPVSDMPVSNTDTTSDIDSELSKDSDITKDIDATDDGVITEDMVNGVTNTASNELMEREDITEDTEVKQVSTTNNEDVSKRQGFPTIGIIFVVAGVLFASVFMSRKQRNK